MNVIAFLLLGILFASPAAAEFCEGNFVTEAGNWTGIEIREGGTIEPKNYNWKDSKSSKTNRWRMHQPVSFGLPEGTPLYTAPIWGVTWVAAYDCTYSYTVICNGHTFTNDTSSMRYKTAWMATPCRHYSDMNRYVDDVSVTAANGSITFKIKGHTTDSDRDKHYSTVYRTVPAGIVGVHEWRMPRTEVTATLTDATMGCTMLEIETPANVLGFHIDARSENHTGYYERNFGMMQRNVTEDGDTFFEIIGATTENGNGMSSFGPSRYLLPKGEYDISMTLYTPFEKIQTTVSMKQEIEETETTDRRSALRTIISMLTLVGGIYFMFRGV